MSDLLVKNAFNTAFNKVFGAGTYPGDGVALFSMAHPDGKGRWRRKRDSKRRWKARARLGQMIPWSVIVDHHLEKWAEWERRHDTMDAYILPKRPQPHFIFATGAQDLLWSDVSDRRWMPL